jgi:hypothetical protein
MIEETQSIMSFTEEFSTTTIYIQKIGIGRDDEENRIMSSIFLKTTPCVSQTPCSLKVTYSVDKNYIFSSDKPDTVSTSCLHFNAMLPRPVLIGEVVSSQLSVPVGWT